MSSQWCGGAGKKREGVSRLSNTEKPEPLQWIWPLTTKPACMFFSSLLFAQTKGQGMLSMCEGEKEGELSLVLDSQSHSSPKCQPPSMSKNTVTGFFFMTPLSESVDFPCITIGTVVVVIVSLWKKKICLLINKFYFSFSIFKFSLTDCVSFFNSVIFLSSMMMCLLPMATMALLTLKWTGLISSLSLFVWMVNQDTWLQNVVGT